jgi:hypothetical protein
MRWRSPSKPRCRFAKLVTDRHRVRRSLTGQLRPDNVAAQIAREQTAAHCRQGHIAGRESLQ